MIRDMLLSDDHSAVSEGLDALERELRKGHGCGDMLDVLVILSGSGDVDILRKVTWCAAKTAQNKACDMRTAELLVKLAVCGDAEVRENAAWGLGEAAGTVEMNEHSANAVLSLLDDGCSSVKVTAAWAAGRLRHKCGYFSKDIEMKLNALLNDPSEHVRSAAAFALE